jgi:hypothetical protein
MYNLLLIKYLLVRNVAVAYVVGENSNNGGRTWNTNNGTNIHVVIQVVDIKEFELSPNEYIEQIK